jgi:hypothetical protein
MGKDEETEIVIEGLKSNFCKLRNSIIQKDQGRGLRSILSPSLDPSDSAELVAGRQARETKIPLTGAL